MWKWVQGFKAKINYIRRKWYGIFFFFLLPIDLMVLMESNSAVSGSSCWKPFIIMWHHAGPCFRRILCWFISCLRNDPIGIIQSGVIVVPVGNKTGQWWNKLLPPKEQHKQSNIELLHDKDHAHGKVATSIRLLWGKNNYSILFPWICIGFKVFPLTAVLESAGKKVWKKLLLRVVVSFQHIMCISTWHVAITIQHRTKRIQFVWWTVRHNISTVSQPSSP